MKALVRVAKTKSNLKFNQLKAYRALNLADMHVLLNKYSDIDMLIFEEIQPDEIDAVKMLASEFSGKTFTFGQIKLDGIDNYTCLSDIQDALDKNYSLSTRTYGRERAPLLYSEVYDERGQLFIEAVPVLEIEDKGLSNTEDSKIEVAETDENIEIIKPLEDTGDNSENIESEQISEFVKDDIFAEPVVEENNSDNKEPVVEENNSDNKEAVVEENNSDNKEVVVEDEGTGEHQNTELQSEVVAEDIFDEPKSEEDEVESKDIPTEMVAEDIFEESKSEEDVVENKDIPSEMVAEDIFEEPVLDENTSDNEKVVVEENNNENKDGLISESEKPSDEIKIEIVTEDIFDESPVIEEDKGESQEPVEETEVEDKKSETEVEDKKPVVEIDDKKSEIEVDDKKSEIEVDDKESETEVEGKEPDTEVESQEPETEVDGKESETEVENKESETETANKEFITEEDKGESDAILSPVFTFEPVIDLEHLNSFNSLIESDKDLVKTMFSELVYYREALYKLSNSDVVLRVSNLNSQLSSYQTRIKELEDEIELVKNDTSKLNDLEEKLKSEQEKYKKLKDDSMKELESIKLQLKTEQDSLAKIKMDSLKELNLVKSQLKSEKDNNVKLQNSLSSAKKEIEGLEIKVQETGDSNQSSLDKIKEFISKNDTLYENYTFVMDALAQLSKKYMSLYENHNKEIAKAQATLKNYQNLLKEKVDLEEKVTDLELENKLSKNKLSETERIANVKLNEFSRAQESLQTKLDDSIHENQNLSLEIDNLKARVDSAERQKQKAVSQVDDLLTQINDKNTLLESKDAIIGNLESQLESVKAQKEDVVELKEAVKVSDVATQELQKEIGRLQILHREQTRELEAKDKRIGELTKANSDLKNNAKALTRSISTGSKLDLFCKYSGHGFVLPIFGSGSYGVTTTAVSIAKKLHADGANVLLMDLDLVSPKCSSYLGISPLLPKEVGALTGLTNTMQYTCMGILIQKETDYFIRERDNFIQQISVNRKTGKHLDFFSGLFGDVEVYKFANVNWDELMNTLGNQYDYIVLDLGRFGGSNEQNALIKMFTNVSLRYLAITTKDKDDIRNMMLKIDLYKLNKKNLIWMLNMASNTQEDDFILRALGQIPHRIMTFNDSMFGQRDKGLFTNAIFKGQFNSVVDLLTMKDMK